MKSVFWTFKYLCIVLLIFCSQPVTASGSEAESPFAASSNAAGSALDEDAVGLINDSWVQVAKLFAFHMEVVNKRITKEKLGGIPAAKAVVEELGTFAHTASQKLTGLLTAERVLGTLNIAADKALREQIALWDGLAVHFAESAAAGLDSADLNALALEFGRIDCK